jgi:hypothetical protein
MLHYNTVSKELLSSLTTLIAAKPFADFRLVGGTALSLYYGHRVSVDIDLFTDASYGSIDFQSIDEFLRNNFSYVDPANWQEHGLGISYFVGKGKDACIKLDIFYTEKFLDDPVIIDDIRLASVEDIIAMKMDVVLRGGRKKDFWDLHELMQDISISHMFDLHKMRYPYTHDRQQLKINFLDYNRADEDFDPICLKGKYWELIKLDLIDLVSEI